MNVTKSAIINHNWKKDDDEKGLWFEGIQVVQKYKFLGAQINRMLGLEDYIGYVGRKVRFIVSKFGKIRNLRKINLNINLFKVFVMPWVRMGALNMLLGNIGNRKSYLQATRKWFRQFCLLPSRCSNETIRWLLADIEGVFERLKQRTEQQWELRVFGTLNVAI